MLKRIWLYLSLIVCSLLVTVLFQYQWLEPVLAEANSSATAEIVPHPRVHPLPATLAQWQDPNSQDDYFSEVTPTEVGYLIWSLFPVKVYIETVATQAEHLPNLPVQQQPQIWTEAVRQAVEEWSVYLPLEVVAIPDDADIAIWRRVPPLQQEGGSLRARSAQTRYELYIRQTDDTLSSLAQRFTILLRPDQTAEYTKAAARHELGHALGIWGHSPIETDVLYFSQVHHPSTISVRDVNTLKRIYEQSTLLGWSLESLSH
jgi:predicted Zn-dependent protease